VPEGIEERDCPPFELGKAHRLAEGDDLAILAYGFPANHALEARRMLAEEGYSVAVYDARFAKPLDEELLRKLLGDGVPVITVEDHHTIGGFGACVLEFCNEHGLPTQSIRRLGLPDRWIYQGGRADQLAEAGIDAEGIARAARESLAHIRSRRVAGGSRAS
jgi:1-deoxy-D-xylulose-5-phosphate synthase